MNAIHNLYCITYTVDSLPDQALYINAENAVEALHALQDSLELDELRKLESVTVALYDSGVEEYVEQKLERTCQAFVEFCRSLK